MRNSSILIFSIICIQLFAFEIEGNPKSWEKEDFIGFDEVGDCTSQIGDISSVFTLMEIDKLFLRITFYDNYSYKSKIDYFKDKNIQMKLTIFDKNAKLFENVFRIDKISKIEESFTFLRTPEYNLFELKIDWSIQKPIESLNFKIEIIHNQNIVDEFSSHGVVDYRGGNAAFVHHGNQSLTYTSVFYGESPDEYTGFDEVLELHQNTGIPGNFHMSGTLMSAAEWYNPEFNDWLATGAQEGWAGILTSAFAQHMMPFVNNNMNNWAVAIEADMVEFLYGYIPHIAWIPERVWLSPGNYPEAGVLDWIGDNFTQHGVNAVILDDWPHCNGSSASKIHWMNNGSGIDLRVIPINSNFVGAMHNDAESAINIIQNTGQYDIVVYGTDWEFAAEVQQGDDPWMLDRYSEVINWCAENYPAVNIWKLDDAINNSDFNGSGIELSNATYSLLGGFDGYGGSNNSWYVDWAGTASESDFHSPTWNYGFIWNDAYNNLATAPNNQLAQLGWYTLMVNLYETGWHEGGVIAEWEKHHSTHIKNTNVYAEASRWANGDFFDTTAAYFNDIDHDGGDELIMHNDRIFAVFEGIGGKINWLYYKDGFGNAYSVIGSDMAYWSETNGDFNESSNNHVAGLSDVFPNQQDAIYEIQILENSSDFLRVDLSQWGVKKTVELSTGDNWLDVKYDFFDTQGHVQSGWSPDLLDLIWSGKSHLQRLFGDWASYVGYRNSANGATAAFVLGSGGANFQSEFEGTLVKGDEIYGHNRFNIKLYAGYTSEPYFGSKVIELDDLAENVIDEMGPQIQDAILISSNHIMIYFDENVIPETAENPTNYELMNEEEIIEIITADLILGRRVTLTFIDDISQGDLDLTIQNITDYAGNNLESNQVEIYPLSVIPHLVGSLNNWNPENHDYDFQYNENGIWELDVNLISGEHQYKILESDQWDGNDWPASNQIIELEEMQIVNLKINPGFYIGSGNGDEYALHRNPVITGNFMDDIGGENWNLEDMTGEMEDENNDSIYEWEILVPAGTWEYKVTLNGSWDQDTQGSGDNFSFYSDGTSDTRFFYNFSNNSTYYETLEIVDCEPDGDVNMDEVLNVVDIVSVVNFILGIQEFTDEQFCKGDRNLDGLINVADIVITVNEILE